MLDKTTIQTVLSNTYNRENWIDFLRDLVGGSYRLNAPQISLPTNEISDKAYELGQFETTDNMLVGVYEVKIKEGVNIENKRVGLRQLLKSVYRVVDAALIVFDTGEAWRFSYVSEIYTRDEAGNRQQLKTDPKRYTYILGKGGGVRTATDRFEGLAKKSQSIKLKDLTDAFSVEILTKDFYRELSDWYFWALTKVTFPDDDGSKEDIRNATSTIRLITRLMFVWFLKQKHLVPDELFEENELRKILKNFNPSVSSLPVFSSEQSSTFYKAILQNLFFATLNTEMSDDKRRFINRQTGVQGFYRYERYFQDKERFLELTRHVPFLNGGLFENLDRNVGEENEVRIDCFSNKLSNESRLRVPDELFFGEETVDLSSVYDDKKRKAVKVKGLINILKSYNFTVEENTPTDIEVALDPELLGKVFENLLASYNPETKSTARKQTGSFYTPREIVEYMVDESLKAYLKEKAGVAIPENEMDERLTHLFSYATDENPFEETQTQSLIKTIDECRILDPACGSGAFPMGVLQRLVFLLRKLDPQNLHWKERQIKRATKEFEEALRNGQTVDIQARVQEITETFQHNTDDYGRKLFLIENSIYGVDIQPIAVQIAKLRFFISLMAEQNTSPLSGEEGRANRGIRPLPNLETKFVAANTLIGLEKPAQMLIRNTQIDALEKQLEEVRHKHFFARTTETKRKYRDRDKELRQQIAKLLANDGWKPSSANQVAAWNPYDQHTHAPFFDPEWMFGITDGFDIVIGNPPYVDIKSLPKDDVKLYFTFFETAQNRINLYSIFIEKGFKLLHNKGILTYITPNSILVNESYQKIRKLILNSVFILLKLPDSIFENAIVETMILTLNKAKKGNKVYGKYFKNHENIDFSKLNFEIFDVLEWKKNDLFRFSIFTDELKDKIIHKITTGTKSLDFYVDFTLGITPYDKYKGHSEYDIKNKIFHSKEKLSSIYVPLLSGKNILRYKIDEDIEEYLKYGDWLGAPREKKFFVNPKIIVRQILSGNPISIYASYTEKELYFTQIGFSIIAKNGSKELLKFILAILNSKMMNFYHSFRFLDTEKDVFQKILIANCKKFPIKEPTSQTPFIRIVDYILHLKKQQNADAELMANYFEQVIDGLVYELYFEEELHGAGVYFHQHLQDLPEGIDNINQTFSRLYDPAHPVRQGLFKLSSIEEVGIIEGKGK